MSTAHADRTAWSWIEVGALLFLFGCAVFCNGYMVGLDDQPIHVSYLARQMDPNFLRGDLLVDAAGRHPSLFWILQEPLVRAFGLEPTYFVLQMLAWLAMLAGLLALARALTPASADRPRFVRWCACVPAVIPAYVFGGILRMDNLLINRTAVMGGELFALALAVRGRAFWSMLLIGLMGNLHITTALHTAVLAGCILIVQPQPWRSLARALAGGLLGLLPMILITVRAMGAAAPAGDGLDYAGWRAAVELHWPYHHFLGWMPRADFYPLPIATLPLLAAWRRTGAAAWLAVVCGVFGLFAANALATEVLHLRIGTILHLYEAGRLLDYVSFVAAPVVFVSTWNGGRREALGGALVLGGVAFAGLVSDAWYARLTPAFIAAIAAGTALVWRRGGRTAAPPRRSPPAWAALVLAALAAVTARVVKWKGFGPSMADVRDPQVWCRTEFLPTDAPLPDAQVCGLPLLAWAKTGLPAGALVVVPPMFLHPIGGLRIRTGRSVLVTFKDGGEATFDAVFAARWVERMRAIMGEIPPLTARDYEGFYARLTRMQEAYGAGDAARFLGLQQRYGATHVICQRATPCGALAFPVVYEDPAWRVFALPTAARSHTP